METDQSVLYIANPTAGKRNLTKLKIAAELLQARFARFAAVYPESLDDLAKVIQKTHADADTIISGGGDGSLNRVLNLMDSTRQKLATFPIGSGNDVARLCNYPKNNDLHLRVNRLLELTAQPTDYCSINNLAYMNSGGFGFDCETLLLRLRMPRWLRSQYYLLAGVTAFSMPARKVIIELPDCKLDGDFYWILGMNNRWIGNGMPITPNAKCDDGLLDFFILRKMNRLKLILCMSSIWGEKHLKMIECDYQQIPEFTITAEEPITHLALDGEIYLNAATILHFKCHHHGIQFYR